MPNGRHFQNVDEFKKILVEDEQQLARALTMKLISYSTGKSPDAMDRTKVDAIMQRTSDSHYGVRSMIHEIVRSEFFQMK